MKFKKIIRYSGVSFKNVYDDRLSFYKLTLEFFSLRGKKKYIYNLEQFNCIINYIPLNKKIHAD